MSNESFKSSQNLRKAMEEAQRLTVMAPTPEPSSPNHSKYSSSPLPVLPDSGSSVLELLRSMSHTNEDDDHADQRDEDRQLNDIDEETQDANSLSGNETCQFQTTSSTPTSSKLPWNHIGSDKSESNPSTLTIQSDRKDLTLSQSSSTSTVVSKPLLNQSSKTESDPSPPSNESNVKPTLMDSLQLRTARHVKKAPSPPLPPAAGNIVSVEKVDQKGEVLSSMPSKSLVIEKTQGTSDKEVAQPRQADILFPS